MSYCLERTAVKMTKLWQGVPQSDAATFYFSKIDLIMRHSVVLLVGVWFCVTFSSKCSATIMGYAFTGALSHTGSNLYGVPIPISAPIAGQFGIDTQLAGVNSPGNPNVALYRHVIPDGVKITVGSLDIRASEYIVSVSNNIPIPGGILADVINIRWASNVVPSLAPIHVNGAVKTTGMFSINLVGNQNLFSNTSLPADLNLSNFMSSLSFLADTPTGSIDLIYNVNSLTSVEVQATLLAIPEPESFWLILFPFLLGQLLFTNRVAPPSSVMNL